MTQEQNHLQKDIRGVLWVIEKEECFFWKVIASGDFLELPQFPVSFSLFPTFWPSFPVSSLPDFLPPIGLAGLFPPLVWDILLPSSWDRLLPPVGCGSFPPFLEEIPPLVCDGILPSLWDKLLPPLVINFPHMPREQLGAVPPGLLHLLVIAHLALELYGHLG